MKIAIGSDHAGYAYKERLIPILTKAGHHVIDMGTDSEESVDYPVFIGRVAKAVQSGRVERGIVLGGSGNGEAMAANRYRRVRAALCWSRKSAQLARQHNNANVISLGQRLVPFPLAWAMVKLFLSTEFEGGRHVRRIRLLDKLR